MFYYIKYSDFTMDYIFIFDTIERPTFNLVLTLILTKQIKLELYYQIMEKHIYLL